MRRVKAHYFISQDKGPGMTPGLMKIFFNLLGVFEKN